MTRAEERKAEEDKRLARLYTALAALIAWARYPGHSDPTVETPPFPDTRYHMAKHVRAILEEFDRHAERTARVLEGEAELTRLRADIHALTNEIQRLRAEMFKLNNGPFNPGERQ